jgi:isoquinoline 1-oxidoreductase beta subunit
MLTNAMLNRLSGASRTRPPSRRDVLKGAAIAAGTLVVAARIDFGARRAGAATMTDPPAPNAFVRIAPDNSVTVLIKHLDMGQGVTTGLTTIVADELDADWAQMRSEFAPADAAVYNNLLFGPVQGTGGSTAVANSWLQLRKAGAAARAMLVAAAAQSWQVPASEIAVEKGVVLHKASNRRASFGEFAAPAARLPVPTEVKLKDPTQWVYIGKHVPRIDSGEKTTGKTVFAFDVKRPGMLTAVVARAPLFGAKVASFDATAAKAVAGVVDVIQIPQGVAVLAQDTWSALKGRDALKVAWDDANAEKRSTEAIFAAYRKLAATPGRSAVRTGDVDAALKGATKVVEAEFLFPYLAHAPMEPLNGVIEVKPDGSVETWAGSQFQTVEQATVAGVFGVRPDQVKINTLWAGGSFGRRATPDADYFAEMAAIAKASGGRAPIHLVWTREDDIKGGKYRPMVLHRVRAGLDGAGGIVGWEHRIVSQSFFLGTPLEAMVAKNGIDDTAVEGASNLPYAVGTLAVDWHPVTSPVSTLWWRSVGHTHTAQAVEVMIDELAHAAGQSPVGFRLARLVGHPRHAAVLRLAAEKGGFGEKLPPGKGRGVAVHESFNSFVAMVADVTVDKGGAVKVDRVVAAVDCGVPINPDVIRAQVEGGIGFGLGAALRGKITLTDGKVDQANFDGYEPLRISDMPKVEVHIVNSTEPPTGIGEPGVPPVAPAVSNAIFAATGKRLHSLPWDFRALRGV